MSSQSAAAVDILYAFAAELGSRTAWGDGPCLYTIRMSRGQCLLDPVPVPSLWWASGSSAEVLNNIAGTAADVRGIPGIRMRPDLYGVAFRFETRDLPWDAFGPTPRDQAEADAAAHQIRARPARIEIRVLAGADRTGTTYESRQQRGQPHVFSTVFPPGRGRGLTGAVPDALRRLTTALTGVPLLQQADPGPEAGR